MACAIRLTFRLGLAALLMGAWSVSAAEVDEQWYVVRFQGQHAGWQHNLHIEDDEEIRSVNRMHLAIRRGPFTVTMDFSSTFVETPDGRPISATTHQKLADQEVEREYTFRDDAVELVERQDGREHRRVLPPIDGAWLPPAAAGRYTQAQVEAGAKGFSFRTLDPTTSLEPFEVTVELLGETVIEVFGRHSPALESLVTLSNLPGMRMAEYVDLEGNLLRSTVDFGDIEMELLAADKDLATAQLDPPELVASTLVAPSFVILRPRQARTAAFRLSVDDGRMPDIAASPVQRVERLDERTLVVRIDLDAPFAPPPGDQGSPPIRNSTMIAGDDPLIIALTEAALEGAGKDAAERAEVLRRHVFRFIQSADLSVGFASASEVARTRQGDCTEYAVLLAAMLQAEGIPARTASGLIYARAFLGQRDIFGYHMWTQAWLDGRWVDLDATLDEPFDATHILLNTSHLDGDERTNEIVTIAPLLGRLNIDLHAE